MKSFMFAFIAAAILLFAGCAQTAAPAQNAGSNATFILPASEVSYFARYSVEENGPMTKEIWRSQDRMRIDMTVQGTRVLSFFFSDAKAYTCSYVSAQTVCYDITGTLSQKDARQMMPAEGDVAIAAQAESVKIGSETGRCYSVPIGAQGLRKLCFAPQGVVAFDSYNVSRTVEHIEYLTDIEYFSTGKGPDAGVFALPAEPVPVPAEPQPPGLEE